MARKPTFVPTPEFNEQVKKEYLRMLSRNGFRLVMNCGPKGSYWKHRSGKLIRLYNDESGQVRVTRLDAGVK